MVPWYDAKGKVVLFQEGNKTLWVALGILKPKLVEGKHNAGCNAVFAKELASLACILLGLF